MATVLFLLHLAFSRCSPAWCDRARLLGSWPNLSCESPRVAVVDRDFFLFAVDRVSTDNLPAAAFLEPPSTSQSFQKQTTHFSTAPIIDAACTSPIRVSTCTVGQKKTKSGDFLAILYLCMPCISPNKRRRSTFQVLVANF